MYLEMAAEEDRQRVENWKADADGMLIFVRLFSNSMLRTDSIVIDRFIFCCCCIIGLGVDSGPSTESTGHLQLLSRKYLSDYFRPKSI